MSCWPRPPLGCGSCPRPSPPLGGATAAVGAALSAAAPESISIGRSTSTASPPCPCAPRAGWLAGMASYRPVLCSSHPVLFCVFLCPPTFAYTARTFFVPTTYLALPPPPTHTRVSPSQYAPACPPPWHLSQAPPGTPHPHPPPACPTPGGYLSQAPVAGPPVASTPGWGYVPQCLSPSPPSARLLTLGRHHPSLQPAAPLLYRHHRHDPGAGPAPPPSLPAPPPVCPIPFHVSGPSTATPLLQQEGSAPASGSSPRGRWRAGGRLRARRWLGATHAPASEELLLPQCVAA